MGRTNKQNISGFQICLSSTLRKYLTSPTTNKKIINLPEKQWGKKRTMRTINKQQ